MPIFKTVILFHRIGKKPVQSRNILGIILHQSLHSPEFVSYEIVDFGPNLFSPPSYLSSIPRIGREAPFLSIPFHFSFVQRKIAAYGSLNTRYSFLFTSIFGFLAIITLLGNPSDFFTCNVTSPSCLKLPVSTLSGIVYASTKSGMTCFGKSSFLDQTSRMRVRNEKIFEMTACRRNDMIMSFLRPLYGWATRNYELRIPRACIPQLPTFSYPMTKISVQISFLLKILGMSDSFRIDSFLKMEL